jgi:hypothetical protein
MVSPNLPAHWFDNRTELAREAVQFNLLRKSHRPKTTTPNILLDNQQIGRRELADWYCECAHRPPPLGSARDGYERPEELELRVGLLRHGMMQVLGWHSFRGAGAMRDLAVVVY